MQKLQVLQWWSSTFSLIAVGRDKPQRIKVGHNGKMIAFHCFVQKLQGKIILGQKLCSRCERTYKVPCAWHTSYFCSISSSFFGWHQPSTPVREGKAIVPSIHCARSDGDTCWLPEHGSCIHYWLAPRCDKFALLLRQWVINTSRAWLILGWNRCKQQKCYIFYFTSVILWNPICKSQRDKPVSRWTIFIYSLCDTCSLALCSNCTYSRSNSISALENKDFYPFYYQRKLSKAIQKGTVQ